MTLTQNRDVDHYVDQELRTYAVASDATIYRGAWVGLDSAGLARPLQAGDKLAGLAYEVADNAMGADGDVSVRAYTIGDFEVALPGAVPSDVGRPVFALDDESLTFDGWGHTYAGLVQDVAGSGRIMLRLDPSANRVRTISHAIEDLGAGIDIAPRAIHAFSTDAWLTAARVVNQNGAAGGIDAANPCVITVSTASGTVASQIFNAVTPFPSVNSVFDLGSLSNSRVERGSVLTFGMTNGPAANPGSFLLSVDYL